MLFVNVQLLYDNPAFLLSYDAHYGLLSHEFNPLLSITLCFTVMVSIVYVDGIVNFMD